ncbi:hypothetical protein C2E23DRAFT_851700 [Lenzites betulinus]|nr:hypothetical protein C2E23DRAFT_851700 [Lenzites betulinus]
MHFAKSLGVGLIAATVALAIPSNDLILINTPPLVFQCDITQIVWVGGQEPYVLTVLKDNRIRQWFSDIPQTNANQTFFSWLTNIHQGQTVSLQVFDALGQTAPTGNFVVQPGPSNCSMII